MTKFLLTATVVVAAVAVAPADEKADRERKVRVAMALAAKPSVAESAPQPRDADFVVAKKLPYLDGYRKAAAEGRPLVLFVGCPGDHPTPTSAVAAKTDDFDGVPRRSVVVLYPKAGTAVVEKTLACPVDCGELKKAVDDAAKKIEPKSAATAPVDTFVKAITHCVCGSECKCQPGDCPAKCPVVWHSDYATAREVARAVSKPLLIVVGTADCYHCRRLEKTLADPSVVARLRGFVCLKLDADREPAVAKAMAVRSYPTTVVAAADGTVRTTAEGFVAAERFVELLK